MPYIGTTGLTSRGQANTLRKIIPASSRYQFMAGVLLSHDMLRGTAFSTNRDPLPEQIADIFIDDPKVLNLIHYHSKEQQTLSQQLFEATKWGGKNLHGFQLNITWPSPLEIDHYRMRFPEKVMVLQIGRRAFALCDNDPKVVAEKVKSEYSGLADYVLLDRSGGHNQLLSVEDTRQYLMAFRCRGIEMGYVIAGGLTPRTIESIWSLAQEFPGLSSDAEGGLRDENNMLVMDWAEAYLKKAHSILSIY